MTENNALATLEDAGLPANLDDLFGAIAKSVSESPAPTGGLPFLKMNQKTGAWTYGVEEAELVGELRLDLASVEHGYMAWHNKVAKKALVPLSQPRPKKAELEDPKEWGEQTVGPQKGKFAEWNNAYSADFVLDDGTVVHYDGCNAGGYGMMHSIVKAVLGRRGTAGGYIIPVIRLSATDEKGDNKTRYPEFEIVDWLNAKLESRIAAASVAVTDESGAAVEAEYEESDEKPAPSGRRKKLG